MRMGDGQVHNVLIVATENDSVYALDANDPTAGPRHNGVLWQDSFIDPANGVTPVPFQDVEIGDIRPVLGITGTPVIDRATKTLYVVSQGEGAADRRGRAALRARNSTPWTSSTARRRTAARSRSATRHSTPTAASPTTPRSPSPAPAPGRPTGWSRSTRCGRTTGPAWCST